MHWLGTGKNQRDFEAKLAKKGAVKREISGTMRLGVAKTPEITRSDALKLSKTVFSKVGACAISSANVAKLAAGLGTDQAANMKVDKKGKVAVKALLNSRGGADDDDIDEDSDEDSDKDSDGSDKDGDGSDASGGSDLSLD